jgi:signal transduction histidine kinase
MKLLSYTYRKLMAWLLLLMAVWGTLFYYTIMEEVIDETNDTLLNDSNILINHALNDPRFLQTEGGPMAYYKFRPISQEEGLRYHEEFFDATVYIDIEDEDEPVRVMKTAFRMPDGQFYELELKISTLERDNMMQAIFWYLMVLFTLFLVCTLIGTRLVLRNVFRPLNQLMHWLNQLEPGKKIPRLLSATRIREFEQLSQAAVDMANRSHHAYEAQKQFTANAAHELQTPLAILRGKVELLAESENLTPEQLHELDDIYSTLTRAVKLNKSLLLLTRIENGQYTQTEEISVESLVDELLPDLLEVYAHKQIVVERIPSESPFVIRCNRAMAQMLVANLLKNALLHNYEGGKLQIVGTPHSLTVANSGTHPLDGEQLFQRFYRSADAPKESTGLGLPIARSIAEAFHLSLTYEWKEGMHLFIIS